MKELRTFKTGSVISDKKEDRQAVLVFGVNGDRLEVEVIEISGKNTGNDDTSFIFDYHEVQRVIDSLEEIKYKLKGSESVSPVNKNLDKNKKFGGTGVKAPMSIDFNTLNIDGTHLSIDDTELKGVKSFNVSAGVNEVPTLQLEMIVRLDDKS